MTPPDIDQSLPDMIRSHVFTEAVEDITETLAEVLDGMSS